MKTALSFSAGKDSAACLWLLKPRWHEIDVVWCNPGDPYPETLEYMRDIKEMVPHFIEVRSDSRGWVREHGYPVDVLPIKRSRIGRVADATPGLMLQSAWDCCGANLWRPMQQFIKENSYTHVIRGQKNCDRLKSPVRSRDVIDGVTYLFPLEDWTDTDVLTYLGGKVPPSYMRGRRTSLDCMRCTAYVEDASVEDLESISPDAAQEVRSVYAQLSADLGHALGFLNHGKIGA